MGNKNHTNLAELSWKVRCGVQQAFKTLCRRFCYPVFDFHSWDWDAGDHQHICYAVRLLEKDDFEKVCPVCKSGKGFEAEYDDVCDKCPYMGSIEFRNDTDGKYVSFYIDETKR